MTKTTKRIKPSASLRSAIEVEVIAGFDAEIADEYAPIRAAWDGSTLDASTRGLHRALNELSNDFDAIAEDKHADKDDRAFARRVIRSIDTAQSVTRGSATP
jgi:hypothetical protein